MRRVRVHCLFVWVWEWGYPSSRPSTPPPPLSDKCSLSALGGRFLSVSRQHSGQPDCLSAAGNVAGDELWCPVLFRNPPEPVCLQPPPLYTHTHRLTKTQATLSSAAQKQHLFSFAVSPSGAHTGVSAEYTNAFSLSTRLAADVHAVPPKQLPAAFLLRVCASCSNERLFVRWSESPIRFSTLPVSSVYMQSSIELRSTFALLV